LISTRYICKRPGTVARFAFSLCVFIWFLQGCLAPSVIGQEVGSRENQKREAKKKADANDEYAISLLRGMIDQANSVEDIQSQAAIISEAAALVWKRDEVYAREAFKRTIDALVQDYESILSTPKLTKSDQVRLQKVGDATNILIKTLSRKDPALALLLLKRYQNARKNVLSDSASSRSISEKFEVIRGAMDSDANEAAALAAENLSLGVPSSFPQFLYDLSSRNAAAAETLYRAALSLIVTNPRYTPRDVILLGAYPFRENAIILPRTGPSGDKSKEISIGVMTSPLSPTSKTADLRLGAEYATAAQAYLFKIARADNLQPERLAQSFFLAEKLSSYVDRLGLGDRAVWAGLRSSLQQLAKNVGVDDSNLQYLAGYANRIANNQVAFLFDNGATLFEKAKNVSDVKERTELLARGVVEAVQNGGFEVAEKRIPEIEDETVRRLLSDYLNTKVCEGLIKNSDWAGLLTRSRNISDPKLRAFLLLESAQSLGRTAKNKKSKQLLVEFWTRSIEALSQLTDGNAKASGLLVVAAGLASVDGEGSIRVMTDAIDEVNKAKDYVGGDYQVELSLMSFRLTFVLPDSDLETAFQSNAKHNWDAVIGLVERVNPKLLRLKARVAACRGILS
jgi:hypothetical protein